MTLIRNQVKKPKRHQEEAIIKSLKYFKKNDRGILSMCCGSGKTLTSLWIAKQLKAKSILVLAPTLNLESQILKTWAKEIKALGLPHHIICIGSDSTIGQEYGVLSTTNLNELNRFLESYPNTVVISTYKSNHLISETGKEFDFAIYDEAHKTAGKQDKYAALLLKDGECKIKKRLFLTATPKNVRAGKKNDEVASMDKVELYGKIIYKLSYSCGIEQGIVGNYEVLMLCHPNKTRLEKDLEGFYNDKKFSVRYINMAYAYVKTISEKKYPLRKVLSFHKSNKDAEAFAFLCKRIIFQCFPELELKVFNLTHKANDKQKRAILKEFEDCEYGILTNCRLFNTGYDLPILDAVLLADPIKNTIEVVQIHGRQGRLHKNKEKGYFILPIEKVEEDYNFEMVIYALAALAKNDENLFHYQVNRVKGNNSKKTESKIIFLDKDLKLGRINPLLKDLNLRSSIVLRNIIEIPIDEHINKIILFINKHNLKSNKEYMDFRKSFATPHWMPSSLHNFLRSNNISDSASLVFFQKKIRKLASFKEFKNFILSNEIMSSGEYKKKYNSDESIRLKFPAKPNAYNDINKFHELYGYPPSKKEYKRMILEDWNCKKIADIYQYKRNNKILPHLNIDPKCYYNESSLSHWLFGKEKGGKLSENRVLKISLNNFCIIKEYPNTVIAARENSLSSGEVLRQCRLSKTRLDSDYIFIYKQTPIDSLKNIFMVDLFTLKIKAIFHNSRIASKYTGIRSGYITSALRSKTKISNGYYWVNKKEQIEKLKALNKEYKSGTPREIIAKKGNEIIFFKSASAATIQLNVHNISSVLNGKYKSAKGWFFRYATREEIEEYKIKNLTSKND